MMIQGLSHEVTEKIVVALADWPPTTTWTIGTTLPLVRSGFCYSRHY